jgi:hypothetical protein
MQYCASFVRKGHYAAKALFFVTFWRLSRQAFSREAGKRKLNKKTRILNAFVIFSTPLIPRYRGKISGTA